MDGQRFDELIRSLTESPSRRSLLGGLTGGVLGGVLSLLGLDDAEAAQKKKKPGRKKRPKKCPPGRKRCRKRCCRKGQVCVKGKCRNRPKPNNPTCTPNDRIVACGTRECGTVPNGCGGTHQCGTCDGPQICNETSGQCDCTPTQTQQEACAERNCGTVPNSCGGEYTCGPATCPGANQQCLSGVCTCVPPLTRAQACQGRQCGTVPTGCGDEVYTCGDGTCPGGGQCTNGQCLGTCGDCENGCCNGNTCETGSTRQMCGHSGGICQTCNPEVECISGECTCTGNSCAQGCCTIVDGKPFCDNTKRRCGDTCIPKDQCCQGGDRLTPFTTPGCWPNETCVVDGTGTGQCRCGNSPCPRNQGCCSLDDSNPPQAFCDTSKRGCGDTCIDKQLCCHQGELGCNNDITCAPETCEPQTGTGQNPPPGYCKRGTVSGICSGACAAGYGYGNYFPEYQREVVCGRASSGTNCFCWRTVEGDNVCTEDTSEHKPCRTSVDCAGNEVCIPSTYPIVGGGFHYICARICA